MKYVVITGVSTGIGAVTTQHLLDLGYTVFGSVRTSGDARRCEETYGSSFHSLTFDVRDRDQIAAAAAKVKATIGDRNLTALVNNAGIAISGPIQYVDGQDIQNQFDINVVGLINVSQAFLPLLGATKDSVHRPGRLINISSVAGTFTMPFQAPYAASKHAVESITDGMRRELEVYGIKVVAIRPGPVKSDIWLKELAKTKNYDSTIYQKIWAKKNDLISEKEMNAAPTINVAKTVIKAIETQKPKSNYLVVKRKMKYYFLRSLPSWVIDRIIRGQFKKMNQ